jgi:hypothetical protein
MVVCDVHAAREGHVIADKEFPVVAQVDHEIRREEPRGQKIGDPCAGLRDSSDRRSEGIEAPEAVKEDAHVHAALHGCGELLREAVSHLSGVENIGEQVDVILRPADGLQHGRIGLVAVDEGLDAVAAAEMLLREMAAEHFHVPDLFGNLLGDLRSESGVRIARSERGVMAHDGRRAALGASYAENGIGDDSDHRHEQDDDGPAQRGTRIAFREEGVTHGHPGQQVEEDKAQLQKKDHVPCPSTCARKGDRYRCP